MGGMGRGQKELYSIAPPRVKRFKVIVAAG